FSHRCFGLLFSFISSSPLRYLHSFPTRRSSDLFAEGAQVFDTQCDVSNENIFVNGTSVNGKQYCKDNFGFDADNMRYSVGAGFTWITMIGPLSLSYAYPLNKKDGDE